MPGTHKTTPLAFLRQTSRERILTRRRARTCPPRRRGRPGYRGHVQNIHPADLLRVAGKAPREPADTPATLGKVGNLTACVGGEGRYHIHGIVL